MYITCRYSQQHLALLHDGSKNMKCTNRDEEEGPQWMEEYPLDQSLGLPERVLKYK